MNVESRDRSLGVEESEFQVSQQASVLGSDTVQPSAYAADARVRERVLEEVLLVEDGDCFGTDCAGSARERRLGGNDAVCLTVAVSVLALCTKCCERSVCTY